MTGRLAVLPPPLIWVVDDDPAVRSSLKFSLEIDGFAVRTYGSAGELLQQMDGQAPACLVVDYRLNGMNGFDLVGELRRRHVMAPVILMTTHPSADLQLRALAAGLALIEKPLMAETLLRSIQAAIAPSE